MAEVEMGRLEIREKPCRRCGHAKSEVVDHPGPGAIIELNAGASVVYLPAPRVRRGVSTRRGLLPRWQVARG